MAANYTDSSRKQSYDCVSRIRTNKASDGEIWYSGVVFTPDGMVNVLYSESDATRMEFAFGGRVHDRYWREQFQPRYLVNLARKFAEDITHDE